MEWSSEQAWSLVALGGIVLVIVTGLPRLLGGGGRLRRGGRRGGRGGYTIRTGPRPSVALALVLVRRLDGAAVAGATVAFAVLLVVNARG